MGILSFLSPHVISGSMTIKPFFDIIFCWLELLLRWAHQTQKQQSSCQQGSSSTRSSTSTPRECSSLHVEQIRVPSSRIRNHECFSRCASASWAFQPSGNTGIVSGGVSAEANVCRMSTESSGGIATSQDTEGWMQDCAYWENTRRKTRGRNQCRNQFDMQIHVSRQYVSKNIVTAG